jgi:hypothetical protein
MKLTTLNMGRGGEGLHPTNRSNPDRRSGPRRADEEAVNKPSNGGPNWGQVLAGVVTILVMGWLTANWNKTDRVESRQQQHLEWAAGRDAQVDSRVRTLETVVSEMRSQQIEDSKRLRRMEDMMLQQQRKGR